MTRRQQGLALMALAYLLWVPGLTLPLLTLDGYLEKAQLAQMGREMVVNDPRVQPLLGRMVTAFIDGLDVSGTVPVYRKTNSVLGTVADLWRSGNGLVSFLVVLFSVLVPVAKAALLLVEHWKSTPAAGVVAHLVSKWSMADVFVVAVLVAFLAISASSPANVLRFDSSLGDGFYFFLGYCIFSILASQRLTTSPMPRPDAR